MMSLADLSAQAQYFPDTPRMPSLFIGHGSPMNAIENNSFTDGWRAAAVQLPRPTAILSVSAHWLTRGTYVHAVEHPRTIHDFYGFPEELYEMHYDCPGSPAAAALAAETLAGRHATLDDAWGIDHGTWVVLSHMYPTADIPVFQVSVDFDASADAHYTLGTELCALRRKGFLILGSGNVVHNLRMINPGQAERGFDWAQEFDATVARNVADADHAPLIAFERLGTAASLSIPTPDHYFPFLTVLGTQEKDERASSFSEGFAYGSVSMRSFLVDAQ